MARIGIAASWVFLSLRIVLVRIFVQGSCDGNLLRLPAREQNPLPILMPQQRLFLLRQLLYPLPDSSKLQCPL